MFLRWFVSSAYREAFAARRQYRFLLEARRDELTPEAIAAVLTALAALDEAMIDGHGGRMRIKIEELQFAADAVISPYPTRYGRMAVEVLLVALVMAMVIRTFFVQPFDIPTGSMEPTLYGVNAVNLLNRPGIKVPTGLERVWALFQGFTYVESVALADGTVSRVGPTLEFLGFNIRQSYWIGDIEHQVWFPPDVGGPRSGIAPLLHAHRAAPAYYKKGDRVFSMRYQIGDYLLADRVTYNFRKPARGEIIVFGTEGIDPAERAHYGIPDHAFFIKRLVALPGEKVRIGDDRHLIIDGKRFDVGAPHFEHVYDFDPNTPPRLDKYSGYLNAATALNYGLTSDFTAKFPDSATVFADGPDEYLAMGDNTVDSQDSRYWGALSGGSIIGKCWFVFWPLTDRFGWRKDR